ncbi:MAG: ring-cleaving dioxygenase [Actinobacteria bacterium]|nr:MAG: ring-cleaving dioxygenase [Actinomycetota bacterium]
MQLEGIHHITAITGDAPRNVDFYARVMGLRLVKKTVNQDDPTIYHLFYGDEEGDPGLDLTFFEYPGASPGRAGDGMIHRIVWRVGSADAVGFWADRLGGEDVATERVDGRLRFRDPEGLEHELRVDESDDDPLIAEHVEVPREMALEGFDGVRAYSSQPEASKALLEQALGFRGAGDGWEVRGERRGSTYAYDSPPAEPGVQSAGTVHHVAFASSVEDHETWRERVIRAGARPTPVIDRFYFRSIYFREPSGVLFELATIGPGFTVDEPLEHLGEHLSLPPAFEHLRDQVEPRLTPLPDVRQWRPGAVPSGG